jgi:hypothetical protein
LSDHICQICRDYIYNVETGLLSSGVNFCYAGNAHRVCQVNRGAGRRSETLPPPQSQQIQLWPVQFWSDGAHIASREHYMSRVLPIVLKGMREERSVGRRANQTLSRDLTRSIRASRTKSLHRHPIPYGAGFVEWYTFCEPWRNHSNFGTWLLGDKYDGYWTEHRDGRHFNTSKEGNVLRSDCYNPHSDLLSSKFTSSHESS